MECSQDQWDIYKLDPLYECYVKSFPNLTVISRLVAKAPPSSPMGPKRRTNASSPDRTGSSPKYRKTNHREFEYATPEDSEEESEVEEMIIDDGPSHSRPRSAGSGDRTRRFREEIERNRKNRREKVARRAERLAREEEEEMRFQFSADPPTSAQSGPSDRGGKRKGVRR